MGVVGALLVADLVARAWAEGQLRDRVIARVQPEGPVSASISSFPFVGRLLASGTISEVDVAVEDLTVRGVTFAMVGVRLRAVRIDRDAVVQDRRVTLAGIGRGTAVVEISGDEISRLLGVTVLLERGQARVRVGGTLVPVAARIEGSTLVVEAAGLSLPAVEIPPLPLVECLAGTEILPGRLRLTCEVDRVPAELAGRSVSLPL